MVVIIDNYDSFTYNLVRYFEELNQTVKVFKNDQVTVEDLNELEISYFVLSPGPCTPNESGICLDVVETFKGKIPILGVCLGHQAIAQVLGAKIRRAAEIRHGKTSLLSVESVKGDNPVLFHNCPETFHVTRYHSLVVDEQTLSKEFRVAARCFSNNSSEIMAIESSALRLYGVQFHPESLLTEYGHQVLKNFLEKG